MPKQSTIHALYRDILMCLVFGLLVVSAHAARQPESKIGEPVFFVNQGQWEQQVLAKAPLNVGDLWITQQGFIFNLLDTAATERVHDRSTAITRVQTHAVFLKFVNPNKGLTCEYDGQLSEAYYNFYKGNKRKSVVKARKYSTIRVKNVWPGIDLEIMSHQGTIKYNWILSPNANAAQIQWQYQGHNQIEITANHCEIQTPWLSWQESIRHVSFVSQEPFLFRDTLLANLTYGLEDLSQSREKAIWDILATVNIDSEVKRLPQGLGTELHAVGSNISGGQLQRLVIARALLRHKWVWLLDEATSAVDAASEKDITDRLIRAAKVEKKSLIAVTHRLTWLPLYDEVWFVEGGRLTYSGHHSELLKDARYRSFCLNESSTEVKG